MSDVSNTSESSRASSHHLSPPPLFELGFGIIEIALEDLSRKIEPDLRAILGMIGMLSTLLSMGMFINKLAKLNFGASTLQLAGLLGWGFGSGLLFLLFLKWFKD